MKDIEVFMTEPHKVQEKIFQQLISKGADTEWGKKYNYKAHKNYSSFASSVPVSPYESLVPYIDRMMRGEPNILWPGKINWFSKSSGTTNAKSKFIPVSTESLKNCHYKGGKDLLALYFTAFPESKLFTGKGLGMGGTYYNNPAWENSYYGDISAVIMANLPVWAQYARTPDLKTALMDEWQAKIEKIAHLTIKQNVTNIAGVPTWTIVLLERILQLTGKKNLLEVWPNFETFYHGAVSFIPYRELFRKFFPDNRILYIETYNASEGFFGMQDRLRADDMLLMLDHGIFYEFIPAEEADSENPRIITLDQVELNNNYALVISTNGGLWRYKIGDTVKFTSLSPYRIKVSGRTKHFINAFGEELIIENAEIAISKASEKTGAVINEFTAAPIYLDHKGKGGHEWVIEFAKSPSNITRFTETLDEVLKQVNSDYEAKRHRDIALQMPVIHAAPQGTFYNWMKKRGKLGGQNKVPRLSNTREYIDDILKDLNQK
ncbi:MAG: GH3 auxin-responsive promoter family protein [Cytophagaceae bacterium]|nr:GH3 auxin-responsive promoter family protein [Cytophagaceae bacterium]